MGALCQHEQAALGSEGVIFFVSLMATLPSQVLPSKNKGVPIMLNYFKTTGSRLLPAGPERGRFTSKEPLPQRERGRGSCAHGCGLTRPPRGSCRRAPGSPALAAQVPHVPSALTVPLYAGWFY